MISALRLYMFWKFGAIYEKNKPKQVDFSLRYLPTAVTQSIQKTDFIQNVSFQRFPYFTVAFIDVLNLLMRLIKDLKCVCAFQFRRHANFFHVEVFQHQLPVAVTIRI